MSGFSMKKWGWVGLLWLVNLLFWAWLNFSFFFDAEAHFLKYHTANTRPFFIHNAFLPVVASTIHVAFVSWFFKKADPSLPRWAIFLPGWAFSFLLTLLAFFILFVVFRPLFLFF